MAPTCDSIPSGQNETTAVAASTPRSPSAAAAALIAVCQDDDTGPFYGMFDSGEAEGSDWVSALLTTSPRCSPSNIPKASETFQRVMRQLDGVEDKEAHNSTGRSCAAAGKKEEGRLFGDDGGSHQDTKPKSTKPVKKSASFSAHQTSSAASSASGSASSSLSAAEAKRRMSVPCIRSGKHVQWADEAGKGSNLVSVRLIRPRLYKTDKDETQAPAPVRSILRRHSGTH